MARTRGTSARGGATTTRAAVARSNARAAVATAVVRGAKAGSGAKS